MGTGTPVNPGDEITAEKMNLKLETVDLTDLPNGTLVKVSDVDVSSNTTTVSFTGLDINADGFYLLKGTVKNATSDATDLYLYFNGDTTNTNYYRQQFYANGSNIGYNRVNAPNFINVAGSGESSFDVSIFRTDTGYCFAHLFCTMNKASNVAILLRTLSTATTHTNITQIDLTASVTDAIAAGSQFVLYKVSI